MSHQLSTPTLELLRLAAIAQSDEIDVRITEVLGAVTDIPLLLSLAFSHSMIPLLHRRLVESGIETPPGLCEELRVRSAAIAHNNLLQAGELIRMLTLLEEEGIPVIAYKGPALAQQLFGDVGLRQFSDLDILVLEKDVPRSVALLERAGYCLEPGAIGWNRGRLPSEGQLLLECAGRRTALEIHWRITAAPFRVKLDYAGIFERSVKLAIGGKEVCAFAPEDLLIILAIHHTKHRWERILWSAEIGRILTIYPDLNFDVLFGRAREAGVLRVVQLALAIAHQFLELNLPKSVTKHASGNPTVDRMMNEVLQTLSEERLVLSEVGERRRFQILARERVVDKLRYIAGRIFVPTMEDRMAVELPVGLFPLYYIIRPLRQAGKRLFGPKR